MCIICPKSFYFTKFKIDVKLSLETRKGALIRRKRRKVKNIKSASHFNVFSRLRSTLLFKYFYEYD